MKSIKPGLYRAVALATVFLAACSSTPLTTSEVAGDKSVLSSEGGPATPIPPGSVLKGNQSLILGQGDQWVGRMVLDIGRDAEIAYKFFYEVYPTRGWNLITAVRGEVSLLVFTNAERSLSVEVRGGYFWGGGTVVVTATPNRAAGASPAMGTPLPARRP
ncbi:MAG: hypothetical protein RIT26_2182 [Pseudomonadota bacterium]|jgi:hypothetical protein